MSESSCPVVVREALAVGKSGGGRHCDRARCVLAAGCADQPPPRGGCGAACRGLAWALATSTAAGNEYACELIAAPGRTNSPRRASSRMSTCRSTCHRARRSARTETRRRRAGGGGRGAGSTCSQGRARHRGPARRRDVGDGRRRQPGGVRRGRGNRGVRAAADVIVAAKGRSIRPRMVRDHLPAAATKWSSSGATLRDSSDRDWARWRPFPRTAPEFPRPPPPAYVLLRICPPRNGPGSAHRSPITAH
jgi:hypothetical protein